MLGSSVLTPLNSCGIMPLASGGSDAAEIYELCQVREEAALKRTLWVPSVHLPGAIFI